MWRMAALARSTEKGDAGRGVWGFSGVCVPALLLLLVGSAAWAQAPAPDPGTVFKDCDDCPEMVAIAAGAFVMGSPETESGRDAEEGPQHLVTITRPFAIGRFEVTFAEWDLCVASGGCRNRPDDKGWGRGRRPAIDVNWNDAKEFLRWLSARTGRTYRLPSEAEWEYAARAGSRATRPWGVALDAARANCGDCGTVWSARQTAPVGSFPANAFGLHDVIGNVLEWVEDCGGGSYEAAPRDGSPWRVADCTTRRVRGGSWYFHARVARNAARNASRADFRSYDLGFRVVRDLGP